MTSIDDVLAELDTVAASDPPWDSDRFFSYVFHPSDDVAADLVALGHEAHQRFSGANGLDPTVFASFARFENDLVTFCRDLVGGADHVVGSFTSGGTESILLAVKAARDARRDELGDPNRTVNLVLADSAHAAFHKAAAYFDLDVRSVAAGNDHRADPDTLLAATDEATAMVVTSAPQFAHGVVDPIEEIAARTREQGLWLHVDACMGGLTMPFLDGAPAFGFDVDGVTSISLDLHKYGYTTKGASIALYVDAAHRRWQYATSTHWTGYPLVNPTMQSTKSGGPLAAAWAVVRLLGRDGYRDLAHRAREATERVATFVDDHELLALTAPPDATLLALVTTMEAEADVFGLAAAMRARGWHLGPTPAYGSSPAHLHLTLTAGHLPLVDQLCADLDAAVHETGPTAPLLPDGFDPGALGPDGLDPAAAEALLGDLLGQVDLVADRARIDATLDALPPELRAVAIRSTLEDLFTP
ncbi:pyridoxal phosphate-dependent decarboxylase family protein [Salsipaludibacter albus]|uniref:pyridoxal phosphate-dependent decarboxylase family protein n=1 Tax=Salsipaludibacter albus TaxID=2849650 RepID=UPI001EE49B71|nr:aminotransferase class V-fold PLP-dependent enzyme [Salsipaludibacter albus]MBY5162344.1 aminotransferase class V-fold PLP-dependent enzyme [Salsipaludibacter albus]